MTVINATEADRLIDIECDVVVIGTGAGGAPMAAELARRGLKVVMVEEGGYHKTDSFNADPTASLRRLYRDAGMTVILGRPPIGYAEGRTVGGSTVINGGMSWRTPERILADWTAEGLEKISAEDMDPFFTSVEETMSVAHQSPESIGRDSKLFALGAKKMGYRVVDNLRNQNHCLGSNNCMFGCPNKAKRSTLVTYIPTALSHGATLIPNCRIEKLTMVGDHATGVVGHFVNKYSRRIGCRFRCRAKVVVVSGGAAQTPALLWKSGFKSKQLGRNLWVHPNAKCVGVFPEPVVGWHGVHQAFQIREFEEQGLVFGTANIPPGLIALSLPNFGNELRELMTRYNDMLVSGVLVEDSHPGRVRMGSHGQPMLTYFTTAFDMQQFIRGVAIQAEVYFAAGAEFVLTPFHDAPRLNSRQDIEKLKRMRISKSMLELFTVHLMGTARMGVSPATSVTDPYGRFHGTDNVFVADASLFPGPIGVNPMETIVALSLRNAEMVARHADEKTSKELKAWTANSAYVPIETLRNFSPDEFANATTETRTKCFAAAVAIDPKMLKEQAFKGTFVGKMPFSWRTHELKIPESKDSEVATTQVCVELDGQTETYSLEPLKGSESDLSERDLESMLGFLRARPISTSKSKYQLFFARQNSESPNLLAQVRKSVLGFEVVVGYGMLTPV